MSLIESAHEFVRRYRNRDIDKTALPMLASACPGECDKKQRSCLLADWSNFITVTVTNSVECIIPQLVTISLIFVNIVFYINKLGVLCWQVGCAMLTGWMYCRQVGCTVLTCWVYYVDRLGVLSWQIGCTVDKLGVLCWHVGCTMLTGWVYCRQVGCTVLTGWVYYVDRLCVLFW